MKFWMGLMSFGFGLSVLLASCVTNPLTGEKSLVLTSKAQEAQMGKQAYGEVLAKEKLSTHPKWNAILQRVGKRISVVANEPSFEWEFRLIDSKEQNAFALPGGKVAFYTGILSVCENEAGLATVMGHEVAHATARHGGQRISQGLLTELGFAGISAALGSKDSPKKSAIMAALGVGMTVGVMLPYSRGDESEADRMGLIYMAKAGYDPKEASRFWGRFSKVAGGGVPEFLSTHPSSGKRASALQAQLPEVLPEYERSAKLGLGEKL